MRLAIVVALAPDRRSGQVLSGIMPADQAIAKVKEAITANVAASGFPNLGAFALDSCLRSHRFKGDARLVDVLPPEGADTPDEITIITVEIGEGDQKTLLNVTSEEEAKFVRDLEASMLGAGQEIERLRTQLQQELVNKNGVNQRLATFESDLAKARADLASCEGKLSTARTDLAARDTELAEIRAALAKAKEQPPGDASASAAKKKTGG